MEEEATHVLLLLMDMMHRKSWSCTLTLWEKSGDSEGSHRAPSPFKEQQHILGLRLLSSSHNISGNSAVFPCTLCIDIVQLIKQWTAVQHHGLKHQLQNKNSAHWWGVYRRTWIWHQVISWRQFVDRCLEEYMCKEEDFTQGTRFLLLEESICGTKVFRRTAGMDCLGLVDLSSHFWGFTELYMWDQLCTVLASIRYFPVSCTHLVKRYDTFPLSPHLKLWQVLPEWMLFISTMLLLLHYISALPRLHSGIQCLRECGCVDEYS